MTTQTDLQGYTSALSPNRQTIAASLLRHNWFRNTDESLQKEILSLPDDHHDFLADLASRPDEIGELDVLKMTKISYGNFLILMVFEVRSNITNQVYTHEYVSWKTGSNPGARGIIFLETNGKITHFLVSKSHKFSSTKEVYDSIGGLYFRFFENRPQNFPSKIEKEICFHLGVDHLEFKKVIDLGKAHPDFGMTNNVSDLFAAIVDVSHLPDLKIKDNFRTTHKPVGFELKIIPISEFLPHLNIIEDNYFLSAAARVLASKEIDLGL